MSRNVLSPGRILAIGVTMALVLGACSSGATASPPASSAASVPASPSAASSASAAASAAASAGGASTCVQTATQNTQAAMQAMQLTLPTDPVSMSKNSGKTIYYIAPVLAIPFIAAIADGVKAAATAAGMKAVIFDGKGNVDTFNQGVSTAVNQKAAAIILQGINPSLVSGPLAQAKAAGIPVIDSLNGDPNQPLPDGVLAHVTVDYTLGGKLMADWVLADSKCAGEAEVFTSSIYEVYKNMLAGFQGEFNSLCPTCKIDGVENIAPDQLATALPTVTSTALQRFPNLGYLVPFYDAMVTNMIPSVQTASHQAKIISHDGVPANLDLIRSGSTQVADVSNPPNAAMGWAEVDEVARLMAGQAAVAENLPQQVFVQSNLPANDANLFPGYAGYQDKYLALWGVK